MRDNSFHLFINRTPAAAAADGLAGNMPHAEGNSGDETRSSSSDCGPMLSGGQVRRAAARTAESPLDQLVKSDAFAFEALAADCELQDGVGVGQAAAPAKDAPAAQPFGYAQAVATLVEGLPAPPPEVAAADARSAGVGGCAVIFNGEKMVIEREKQGQRAFF